MARCFQAVPQTPRPEAYMVAGHRALEGAYKQLVASHDVEPSPEPSELGSECCRRVGQHRRLVVFAFNECLQLRQECLVLFFLFHRYVTFTYGKVG